MKEVMNWKVKSFSVMLLLFLFIPIAFSLDECKGTMTIDDVPCYFFLPYDGDCTTLSADIYNAFGFIYSQSLSQYQPFLCNGTFNQTIPGTYVGNYSSGDSFSFILEVGYMNILIYIVLFALIVIFLFLMHSTSNYEGANFIYAALAGVLSYLSAAMLFFGFKFLNGVTIGIDVNYYLSIIVLLIGVYCTVTAYNYALEYKTSNKKEEYDY